VRFKAPPANARCLPGICFWETNSDGHMSVMMEMPVKTATVVHDFG
jgi:hypothetical protein